MDGILPILLEWKIYTPHPLYFHVGWKMFSLGAMLLCCWLPCNHCAAQLDNHSLGILQLVPGVEGRPPVQVVELHQGRGQGDALVEVPLLHVGHSGLRPSAKDG